ncbi:MFS transporter [Mycobacterium hubeiense]|uniref:MFS transporter n=1 Tax=Mycobacterium hubeiense TaxID=1867256 RepID=UPI000C7EC484|nr:MFS transporter [Mycobacterium sp. QGD 101]
MTETQAPPDTRRWWALALLSVAQFMLILDVTVVTIALPHIGPDLELSRATLTWVMSAYTLLFGGLMLVGGRAADLFGARKVVIAGLALFTVASLVAGLAVNGAMLVGGRVEQGIGAALLSPAALSIVSTTFQGDERNRALGVWASLGGAGFAVGVILGGVLTAGPGWPWVFYINLPVGLAVLAALPATIPARRGDGGRRIDLAGAAIATTATGAAIYGLINAGDHGWTAPWTLIPIAAAAVLYLAFAAIERAAESPLVNLGILTRRATTAGAVLMLVASGLLIAEFFLGSFYLQHQRGFSALATGLLFLPAAVGTIVGATTAGHAIAHLGGRTMAGAGLALAAAGAAVPALWLGTVSLVAGIGVAAAGLGATFVAATTTALARVEHHEAGVTSGIVNTFHELGAALGVAAISSIAAASLITTTAIGNGFTRGFGVAAMAALVAALVAVPVVPAGKPPAGMAAHAH